MQSAAIGIYFVFGIVAISCVIFWSLEVWYVEKKLALIKSSTSINQSHRIIQFLHSQRQNHPYWHSATLSLPYLIGITVTLVGSFSNPFLLEFNGALSYFLWYILLYAAVAVAIYYDGREYARKNIQQSGIK